MGNSELLDSLSCRESNDWAIDIMSNIEKNQCIMQLIIWENFALRSSDLTAVFTCKLGIPETSLRGRRTRTARKVLGSNPVVGWSLSVNIVTNLQQKPVI